MDWEWHLDSSKLLTYDIRVRPKVARRMRELGYKDSATVNCIATNLISCLRKGKWLAYSRNTGHKASNKKGITVRRSIRAVDFLVEKGLVVNHIGTAHPIKEKRQISALEPTEEFMEMFSDDPELIGFIEKDFIEGTRVIELRDSTKNEIKYGDDKSIKRKGDVVRELNLFLHSFDCRDGKGRQLDNVYCRIFNEKFEWGGRWYRADVLAINNKENKARLDITLDGKEVVEVDFRSLHLRIAAAMYGLPLERYTDDAYAGIVEDASGVDRKIIKLAVNTLFNCDTEAIGTRAISKHIRDLSDKEKEEYTLGKAADVKKLIYNAYPVLAKEMCTGDSFGMVLQNADSELASDIIEDFLDLRKPILPVHDSFITTKDNMEVLCNIMARCFKRRFEIDAPVPLTIEYKEDGKLVTKNTAI